MMNHRKREALARRGAYVSNGPYGIEMQLEPNRPLSFWDQFSDDYSDVLSRPDTAGETATFRIKPRDASTDAGFVQATKLDHIVLIRAVYVWPHMRGNGIGRRVIAELAKHRSVVAQVLPFELYHPEYIFGIQPPVASYSEVRAARDRFLPDQAPELLRLYETSGWSACAVADYPDKTFATNLKQDLRGFIHLLVADRELVTPESESSNGD
jgi:GNAT superfamily N-acetyltransferase